MWLSYKPSEVAYEISLWHTILTVSMSLYTTIAFTLNKHLISNLRRFAENGYICPNIHGADLYNLYC